MLESCVNRHPQRTERTPHVRPIADIARPPRHNTHSHTALLPYRAGRSVATAHAPLSALSRKHHHEAHDADTRLPPRALTGRLAPSRISIWICHLALICHLLARICERRTTSLWLYAFCLSAVGAAHTARSRTSLGRCSPSPPSTRTPQRPSCRPQPHPVRPPPPALHRPCSWPRALPCPTLEPTVSEARHGVGEVSRQPFWRGW